MEDKLARFCQFIKPNEEFTSHCDKTVKTVFHLLKKHSEFNLESFHMGGGIPSGKNTSTTLKVDADVVINVVEILPNPTCIPDTKNQILKEWKKILEDQTECDEKDDMIELTTNSLGFRYRSVWIDLLVAIPQDPSYKENLAKLYRILKISDRLGEFANKEAVMERLGRKAMEKLSKSLSADLNLYGVDFMKGQSEFVIDVARLAKFWNQTVYYGGIRNGKSFFVELVAVSAAKEEENRSSDNGIPDMKQDAKGKPSYLRAFTAFLTKMENISEMNIVFDYYTKSIVPRNILSQVPLLLNPVNPCQNLASEVADKDYVAIMMAAARNTIDKFHPNDQDFEKLFSPKNTQNIFNQICMRNIILDFVLPRPGKSDLMPTIDFNSLWLKPKIGRNGREIVCDKYKETRHLLIQLQRMIGSVVRCRMFSHPESNHEDIERSVGQCLAGICPGRNVVKREHAQWEGVREDVSLRFPLSVQERGDILRLVCDVVCQQPEAV